MDPQNIKALLSRLDATMAKAFESAAGACIQRTHFEISVEHCLIKLLDLSNSDFCLILKAMEKDPDTVRIEIEKSMGHLKSGNFSKPKFSAILLDALSQAWNFGSLERGEQKLRSGHFLVALLRDQLWLGNSGIDSLKTMNPDAITVNYNTFTEGSDEVMLARPKAAAADGGDAGVLDAFTVNLVEEAKAGNIDPVIGRDEEIHQVIDILSRRRKNNPILLGEPGVGKSAIVEGLARFIVEGKVPDMLQGVHIRTLDLGMLKAGASMKGEFEQRLKDVIDAVQAASPPVILFIDEAHTLIGAGGAAGSGDAANLLKPALARGQLRTIAATTWSEYKKYIEKDPALERRFQVVKIGEPSIEKATDMLRGLKSKYEDHHKVVVLDSAIETAVQLSSRFISGRQLPDKAIDLLDTSCARVRLSLESEPFALTILENKITTMTKAIEAKEKDEALTFEQDPKIEEMKQEIEDMKAQFAELKAKWQAEREQVDKILALQTGTPSTEGVEGETAEAEPATDIQPDAPEGAPSEGNSQALKEAQDVLAEIGGEDPLISYRVTPQLISQIISGWTGIPVGKMVKDELAELLKIDQALKKRVIGQDHVADRIASAIKSSKAKVNDPNQPIGVFLAVGPSGTGKTEMALAIANTLFGGERFVVQINMSEYQEKHTVSRLIGSPPGYVGYGEGGVLSEAVRQRPYSVVLLDEVEKGHPDVMNLFYQVFDKGYMADGEGRHIDFKNTLIMMTSNLGSDITEDLCSDEEWPSAEELLDSLRPTLNQFLKPALLARMTVLPYFPLSDKVMKVIVGLKLHKIVKRLKKNHGIAVGITSSVVQMISERCQLVEAGARNIDAILKGQLLPQIANAILEQLMEGNTMTKLKIDAEEQEFILTFEA